MAIKVCGLLVLIKKFIYIENENDSNLLVFLLEIKLIRTYKKMNILIN